MTIKLIVKDGLDSPEINFSEGLILCMLYDSDIIYDENEKDTKEEYFPFIENIPEINKIS